MGHRGGQDAAGDRSASRCCRRAAGNCRSAPVALHVTPSTLRDEVKDDLDDALGRIFPGIVWREAGRMDPVPAFLTCAVLVDASPAHLQPCGRDPLLPPFKRVIYEADQGTGRLLRHSPRRAHPPAGLDRPSAAQAGFRPQPGGWRAPCRQYLPMTAVPATRSSRPELERDCGQVLSGKYGMLESGGRRMP